MTDEEIEKLLAVRLPNMDRKTLRSLVQLCGGWPLLAQVVSSTIHQDMLAGATPRQAVELAESELRSSGPAAFDVRDDDQRETTISSAIRASLHNLEERVAVAGDHALCEKFLSLAAFPAATPIPLNVLSVWFRHVYGWNDRDVRHFCRLLANRSLLSSYKADTECVLLHDVFRSYLVHETAGQEEALHQSLLDSYQARLGGGRWSELPAEDHYIWSHLIYHLSKAGLQDDLLTVLSCPEYIATKAELLGHLSLQVDLEVLTSTSLQDRVGYDIGATMLRAAFLFLGMTRRKDIAATLLSLLVRSFDAPDITRRLTVLLDGPGDYFRTKWWRTLDARDAEHSGHVGAVTSVATSSLPQADILVSGGEDGTMRIWDVRGYANLAICTGHAGWVHAVALSRTYGIAVSAGEDGSIRLWNASSGTLTGVLVQHVGRVRCLAFDRIGRLLVSAGEDAKICVWDVGRQRLIRTFDSPCPVWSVAISRNDKLLAVGGEDPVLRLFALQTGHPLDQSIVHSDWIRSVAFSPKEPLLASGSGDGTVAIWNASEVLDLIATLDAGGSRVRSVSFSDSGAHVAAGCEDGIVRIWSTASFERVDGIAPGVDWIRSVTFSSDDRSLIGGCEDGVIRLWEVPTGDVIGELGHHSNAVWSLAFASGPELVVTGRADGCIQIRNAASGEIVRALNAGPGRVWSLATAAATLRVAASCGDGLVRLWNIGEDDSPLEFGTSQGRPWSVALDSRGKLLAEGTGCGVVRIWDVDSQKLLFESKLHSGRVRSLAFDSSGERLVSGSGDGAIRLWDIRSQRASGRFQNEGTWVRSVALDASGRYIAAGLGSGAIQIWDSAGGAVIAHLLGHAGRVLSLSFDSSATHLLSGAADGTMRFWSVTTGAQLCQIRVDGSLLACAGDACARRALAASSKHLLLLDLRNGELRLR